MSIYSKVAKALVYDLINEANPTLSKPVTETNAKLGVPTAIASAVFPAANTTIVLSPAPGTADYIGRQTLKYRRLDLSRMFRGITVTVTKFSPKYATVGNGGVLWTLYELLPDINKLYGLKLTEDDLTAINVTKSGLVENGQGYTIANVTVKATSLGFVGSFALKWVNTPQSIADMITNTDLDGRFFPGGNLFDGTHKPILDPITFGEDATSIIQPGLQASAAFGRQGIGWNQWGNFYPQVVLPYLRQLTGQAKWRMTSNGSYKTFDGEVSGMEHALYQLPNPAWPEGNDRFYGWALVIFIPEDCTWATGQIVFHFNKV